MDFTWPGVPGKNDDCEEELEENEAEGALLGQTKEKGNLKGTVMP